MKFNHFVSRISRVLALLFLFSCSSLNKSHLPDTLSGHWRTISPDSTRIEIWKQISEDSFSGYGGLITGRDTLITETLKLIKRSDTWIYQATVPDQNEGKTISFTESKRSDSSIEFSNPEHDFPQKLIYSLIEKDTLRVIVSGGTGSFSLQFVKTK